MRFEYRMGAFDEKEKWEVQLAKLQELGAKGWELVDVVLNQGRIWFYFKREFKENAK